ncbi:MAG: HPr family phosphocarrier protein [Candidatus Cloacimonadota bacterium]|nr:MAG: HPr family phosphocarrier protein [Candidatus Cloacimonadota bacterium]
MTRRKVRVLNKLGIHARPAAMIVRSASKYRSDFFIEKHAEAGDEDDLRINGKSIMGVMMLAAEYMSELELIANGVDENELLDTVEELFIQKFGEE